MRRIVKNAFIDAETEFKGSIGFGKLGIYLIKMNLNFCYKKHSIQSDKKWGPCVDTNVIRTVVL